MFCSVTVAQSISSGAVLSARILGLALRGSKQSLFGWLKCCRTDYSSVVHHYEGYGCYKVVTSYTSVLHQKEQKKNYAASEDRSQHRLVRRKQMPL